MKVVASGCRDYEECKEEVEVDDDYSGPPIPPIKYCKHIGDAVDSGTIEVEDSMFLLYKVQYGEVLEKKAMHS